jgi:hypothetical protein
MRVRNHGKYTHMSKNKPRAIARCDYSGFMVQHAALIRQMEYRGQGLVFTGYYVHPKFADTPQPQNLTPRIKLDPVPIRNARPDNIIDAQNTLATSVGVLTIDVSPSVNVTLTTDQFSNNGSFNFTGTLTNNIVIYVPNLMKQFYANKLTTGPFNLSMQLIGNVSLPLIIPQASPTTLLGPIVTNTLLNLEFLNF